ncbi:hypothetical protein [Alkalihalobacterium chitinilyticum]|uniref:Uncharacterized protein n=1 Tax=Alkalihalobacterium chitinilyticum TaxID=2980103 RepID=A0ABT5VID7_9BACI|nr:hypothetical protein [Alkalihalobacterium chitinilyticum]MDE5415082.1 hypothetical protein [Alkalihalobacterium chitinilyticum]
MKILKSFVLYTLAIILIVILTIAIYLIIVALQGMLFVPEDYMMWIFKYPASRFVLVYEILLIISFFYLLNRRTKKLAHKEPFPAQKAWRQRNKKRIYIIFIMINIVLFYMILTSVTVITNTKIIDYSYLAPQGKEYSYQDIAQIHTGVFGDQFYLPFTHSKGQFYYIIELKDGSKIDLTEVGGVKDNEHEYFMIAELDSQLVNLNIPKVASMDNFHYSTDHLDQKYTDQIRKIIKNTN